MAGVHPWGHGAAVQPYNGANVSAYQFYLAQRHFPPPRTCSAWVA
jgi:hypothetical protein